jgi:hypothetical protein
VGGRRRRDGASELRLCAQDKGKRLRQGQPPQRHELSSSLDQERLGCDVFCGEQESVVAAFFSFFFFLESGGGEVGTCSVCFATCMRTWCSVRGECVRVSVYAYGCVP